MKIRRPLCRLIFIIGISSLVRQCLYIEPAPMMAKALGSTSIIYRSDAKVSDRYLIDVDPRAFVKPRSHCADHSLPMFPIIADRPDLSWSWQNHQIVAFTPDLCLSKTVCTILVRQLYDTGTTEVFDPLLVRFRRPLVRPLIRSTRLYSRCWRPHSRSCRCATTIKTT